MTQSIPSSSLQEPTGTWQSQDIGVLITFLVKSCRLSPRDCRTPKGVRNDKGDVMLSGDFHVPVGPKGDEMVG